MTDEVPIVGHRSDFEELKSEYESSSGFALGIDSLSSTYTGIRRVVGDGNCFYRCLLFSYVETLSTELNRANPAGSVELARIIGVVKASKEQLVQAGYTEIAFETFYDMFLDLLQSLPKASSEEWHSCFLNDESADYYTWFLRLLTACSLKRNAARFEPFLDAGYTGIADFCCREVEPMGVECDYLQISALTEYLSVRVRIVYLENKTALSDDVLPILPSTVEFPESGDQEASFPAVHLLYRPGHYDMLCPGTKNCRRFEKKSKNGQARKEII